MKIFARGAIALCILFCLVLVFPTEGSGEKKSAYPTGLDSKRGQTLQNIGNRPSQLFAALIQPADESSVIGEMEKAYRAASEKRTSSAYQAFIDEWRKRGEGFPPSWKAARKNLAELIDKAKKALSSQSDSSYRPHGSSLPAVEEANEDSEEGRADLSDAEILGNLDTVVKAMDEARDSSRADQPGWNAAKSSADEARKKQVTDTLARESKAASAADSAWSKAQESRSSGQAQQKPKKQKTEKKAKAEPSTAAQAGSAAKSNAAATTGVAAQKATKPKGSTNKGTEGTVTIKTPAPTGYPRSIYYYFYGLQAEGANKTVTDRTCIRGDDRSSIQASYDKLKGYYNKNYATWYKCGVDNENRLKTGKGPFHLSNPGCFEVPLSGFSIVTILNKGEETSILAMLDKCRAPPQSKEILGFASTTP
jgi:hypothetical protein